MDRCDTRKPLPVCGVWSLGPKPGFGAAGCVRGGSAHLTHWVREKGGKKDNVLHLGNSAQLGKAVNSCSVGSSSELWEQTMPLLWHSKVDTAGRDPQRNNRMWIRTVLWFKKVKANQVQKTGVKASNTPSTHNQLSHTCHRDICDPSWGGATGQILNQTGDQVILCGQTKYPWKIRGSNNDNHFLSYHHNLTKRN